MTRADETPQRVADDPGGDQRRDLGVVIGRRALDDLDPGEREGVRAFALSVDPANDTPESAQEFLLSRRVRGYLDYLLGTPRELQPVWRKYGFAPQTKTQEHNSYVVLLDGAGLQRVGFPVQFLTPEALTHDIQLLLEGTRAG